MIRHIVTITIGLSITVFAVLRVFQTDGRTDRRTDRRNRSSNRRHYAVCTRGRVRAGPSFQLGTLSPPTPSPIFSAPAISYHHRLNGSSSPVLTATCLSYGSLCDFLGFSTTDLEVTPLDRFLRKMAQTTWFHAKTCLLD